MGREQQRLGAARVSLHRPDERADRPSTEISPAGIPGAASELDQHRSGDTVPSRYIEQVMRAYDRNELPVSRSS